MQSLQGTPILQKKTSIRVANHALAREEAVQPSLKLARPKPRPVGIRRPLRVHHERLRIRTHVQRSRKKATRGPRLQEVLSDAGRSFTGNVLHPIAVNAWLASEEPIHADMLRDCLEAHIAELDTLVDRFKGTSLSDTNLLANPLIDVPRGFRMQLVCYSQDYGALITEAKRREGAFLHMGLRGSDNGRSGRRYGFDPTEVLKHRAISFHPESETSHSTLDNEVHPLLQHHRFHGCPLHVYDQLKPGLQLATHLLQHRATAHFWHTVAFGNRVLDENMTIYNGYRCFRLLDPVQYSTEDAHRFTKLLASLISTLHFHFSLWPLPNRAGLYAGMAIVSDYKRGESYAPRSPQAGHQRHCRICLHTDFYTTAQRLAKLANPDPSLVLRFNFFVAITVCHELAHFVEMNSLHEGASSLREGYWGGKSWAAEMGSAFEEAVFGGKVHPIGARVDCAWGCTVYDNPNSIHRGRQSEPRNEMNLTPMVAKGDEKMDQPPNGASLGLLCDLTIFYTVPMDYIAKLQQKETWDAGAFDEDDLDAGKALIIPRDGAQAVSVPVFDMVVWNDEASNAVSDENDAQNTPWRRMQDGSIIKVQTPKLQRSKTKDVSMADLDLDLDIDLVNT